MINKFLNKIFFLTILFFVFSFPIFVNAASLSFSPLSSSISTGNIVSVKIIVNTSGKNINNAEGIVEFPTDLLEVVSISKSPSIFSLWVEEPSFSNKTGKITFNGGIANPGYNGASGSIASVVFKAKKEGVASLIFSDGAVRENDGLGTNILTSKNSSSIKISSFKKEVVEEKIKEIPIVVVPEKVLTPDKPTINSSTHQDQNAWYSNGSPSFNWDIPNGVTHIQTLLNTSPDSVLNTKTTKYDSSVTEQTITNLSDGVYYFHLRYLNSFGWSPVAHFRVKIDKTNPETFLPDIRLYNNQYLIKLNSNDLGSGIDYYSIKIDNQDVLKVPKSELINDEFILPTQDTGSHKIIIFVYDNARNNIEVDTTFESSGISVPELSLSSNKINKEESFTIYGKSIYPNEKIEIYLESNGKEINRYTQVTKEDGSFILLVDGLKNTGIISISARVLLANDVKSNFSEKIFLEVSNIKVIKITLNIMYPTLMFIFIIILLIIFLVLFYLGWYKFFMLKKKMLIKKETKIETKILKESENIE